MMSLSRLSCVVMSRIRRSRLSYSIRDATNGDRERVVVTVIHRVSYTQRWSSSDLWSIFDECDSSQLVVKSRHLYTSLSGNSWSVLVFISNEWRSTCWIKGISPKEREPSSNSCVLNDLEWIFESELFDFPRYYVFALTENRMTTGTIVEARISISISEEREPNGGCFSCPEFRFDLCWLVIIESFWNQ